MTSYRRYMPTRFLINQCHILTFLILKSDNIENSRIELKGIVLPVPSNQIKVTFIIILPFVITTNVPFENKIQDGVNICGFCDKYIVCSQNAMRLSAG